MNDLNLIEKKIKKSKDIIYKMMSLCQKPYIALSFGKDSLVMLDLIYEDFPSVKCIFLKSEESYLMYNFEELIAHYKDKLKLNLHIVETKRLTENNGDWQKARKAGNKDFFLDDFKGYDGVFMGLRIEESKQRRISILKKENNSIYPRIMQYKNGFRESMYRCCPIADWTAWEIGFYAQQKGLKLLDIYEQFGTQQRTTARLTGDAVRQNTLFWIKRTKPENWNKLIELLPELKMYV